jgi:predicted glycosyltransferase
MMAGEQAAHIRRCATELGNVQVFEYRRDVAAVLAGARAVVAMAGYCTVAEILASGRPALLVPRAFPRQEQLNRARHWAGEGRVALLEPQDLEPVALKNAITDLLHQPGSPPETLSGAEDAATILHETARARLAGRT